MIFWKTTILLLTIGFLASCSTSKSESSNSEQGQQNTSAANQVEVDTTTFEYFLADFKQTILEGDSLELVKNIRFPLTEMNWENEEQFLRQYSDVFTEEFKESMKYSDRNILTEQHNMYFEDLELIVVYTWHIRNERSPDFPSELEWNWAFLFAKFEGEFKLFNVFLAG